MRRATGGREGEGMLQEEAIEEIVLTKAEVKTLTERFLFGDPSGPVASGDGPVWRGHPRHPRPCCRSTGGERLALAINPTPGNTMGIM